MSVLNWSYAVCPVSTLLPAPGVECPEWMLCIYSTIRKKMEKLHNGTFLSCDFHHSPVCMLLSGYVWVVRISGYVWVVRISGSVRFPTIRLGDNKSPYMGEFSAHGGLCRLRSIGRLHLIRHSS